MDEIKAIMRAMVAGYDKLAAAEEAEDIDAMHEAQNDLHGVRNDAQLWLNNNGL